MQSVSLFRESVLLTLYLSGAYIFMFNQRSCFRGLPLAFAISLWAIACTGESENSDISEAAKGGAPGVERDEDVDGETEPLDEESAEASPETIATKAFELVEQSPEPNSNNASALQPLTLEFSAPVEAATVSEGILLQAGGQPLLFDFEISGTLLTLTPKVIPNLPATVSVSLRKTLTSTDGTALSGQSWNFEYPFWQTPDGTIQAARDGLSLISLGSNYLLSLGIDRGTFHAQRLFNGNWSDFETPALSPDSQATWSKLLKAGEDAYVAFIEEDTAGTQKLKFAQLKENKWRGIGGVIATGSDLLADISTDASGDVFIGVSEGDTAKVYALNEELFVQIQSEASFQSVISELQLSLLEEEPVLAGALNNGDIEVIGLNDDSMLLFGNTLDRERIDTKPELQLEVLNSEIFLAYLDGDSASRNVQVRHFRDNWEALGTSLDLVTDAEARLPRLAFDSKGVPFVSWVEGFNDNNRLFVARQEGDDWRFLGTPLMTGLSANVSAAALTLDDNDLAFALISDGEETSARRYNGSPELPLAKTTRGEVGDCNIPAEGPGFPAKLSETGCYLDVPNREVVSAAFLYKINSVLWADGEVKRRLIVLPEGTTMTFQPTSTFGMPVGTIIIKEFLFRKEADDPETVFPLETRFWVKRCEEDVPCSYDFPWEGYSYQWNDAGNEAFLLPEANDAVQKAWETNSGTHTHEYPSRAQCQTCHNKAAERVLGVQGAQLNSPLEYESGVIENQLRAMNAIGLFGEDSGAEMPESLVTIPTPKDVGQSLETRSRAYFQSNCAHCHLPGGPNVAIDFRYFGTGVIPGGNICDNITPGDHLNSSIWVNDATRVGLNDNPPGGMAMPPISTLLRDDRQLEVTKAWIEAPDTCAAPP